MCPCLQVFDLLVSMADFATFKELMLAYKEEEALAAGQQQQQGAFGVHCSSLHIHQEEQEEGEERPDLDGAIKVTSPRT